MNRVVSSPPSYEYLRLNFTVSRSLIETAMTDSDELRITIAKIMCYSLIIFILIASFESIVMNGTKVVLNVGIWTLNTSNSLFFGAEVEQPPSPSPLFEVPSPIPIVLQAQIVNEPLPALLSKNGEVLDEEFKQVFEILATSNPVGLLYHTPYLASFRE